MAALEASNIGKVGGGDLYAAEQGLQIECGVERVGEAHQVGNIGRLDARIHGIERRVRSRAIIPFEFELDGWDGWVPVIGVEGNNIADARVQ